MTNYELDLLRAAHQRNADKLGCTIGNFGWVIDRNSICSKTNQGYLTSTRHGHRNYEHKLQTN
jgi:hypothetical protein